MSNGSADFTPALFQSERQREIVMLAMEHDRVEVAGLADRFGVTTETIRRDLSDLQKARVLRRVHGGAVRWETSGFEPLLSVREDQHADEKRRMAEVAVEELPDRGSIIIDSGSTLTRFAETLPATTDLRVVTNSLRTAQTVAQQSESDVILIGGKVRKNTMAVVDASAIATIEPMTVDTLFISSDGLTAETGLTTPYREEAALKRAMIQSARRVVALVDHSKFGQDHFIRFASWHDVDVLITTREVSPAIVAEIETQGTTVLLA